MRFLRFHSVEEIHYTADGIANKDFFTLVLGCVNEDVCEMNSMLYKYTPDWANEALKDIKDFSMDFKIDVEVKDFCPGMVSVRLLVYTTCFL